MPTKDKKLLVTKLDQQNKLFFYPLFGKKKVFFLRIKPIQAICERQPISISGL